MELSIIVVNWNTRDMTLACLRSVIAETRSTRFELLVVDNGSTDGSAQAIAAGFPEVRMFAETANHGFARANNIAAEAAQGRYLLLLNSDTLVRDGAIDRLMEFARRTPQAGIWGGRTVFADLTLNPASAWGRITLWSTLCFAIGLTRLFPASALFNPEGLGGWDRSSERAVDIVSGCFFLIDAALWQRLDGFDTRFFMYGEEADLCARASALGANPRVTPEATIVHYGGASSTRASTTSYVLGAKVELARRSLNAASAWTVRALFTFAVALRASAYGAASLVTPRAGQEAARWRAVWGHRRLWQAGPISAEAAARAF